MLIRLVLSAALLVVLPALAAAPSYIYAPTDFVPAFREGWVDFGVRGSDVTGDAARFQRFRDLSDGPFVEAFRFNRATDSWLFKAAADHLGRDDQRYRVDFTQFGLVEASFSWDQIPLFISEDTQTLYSSTTPGVIQIDDGIQQAIQNQAATIGDFRGDLRSFDSANRRDTAAFGLVATPSTDWDVKVDVTSARRKGTMPYGASFGFSQAVEVPAPLDSRQTNIGASAEWTNRRGMVRFGYDGSWFNNDIPTMVWDNPLRLTDSTNVPSRGRYSLWPDNTAHTFSFAGAVKMPARSRLVASAALGKHSQNGAITPYTINSALQALPLDRLTAQAEARTVASTIRFTSRPNRVTSLTAQFQYYDYDNQTPHFASEHYYRFDGGRQRSLGAGGNEPYSIKRQDLDVDASFTPIPYTAFKIGYGHNTTDRTHRFFGRTTTNEVRVAVDTTGNAYATVRGQYEFSSREGSELDPHALEIVGEQPGMRHYDVGDRDRSRATVLLTLTPTDVVGINASLAAGRDDYQNPAFGLLNNDHTVYTVGLDTYPTDTVAFGVSYGFENYDARQRSRQARPGPQFDDPSRNWALDSGDEVNSLYANFDLLKLIPNMDLRFSYDFSDTESMYLYDAISPGERTVPEGELIPTSLGAIDQLPPVSSQLTRAVADTRYFLTERASIGVVYWFEQYEVTDFALGPGTLSPLDIPGGMLLNYLYRPYRAHTVWLRMTYLW